MEATVENRVSGNGAAVFLDSSTSSFDPKVQPRETGRTSWVVSQEATCIWNTIYGRHGTSEGTLPGSSCLDTLSKIFKGMMDIQRKLSAIMGQWHAGIQFWEKAVQPPSTIAEKFILLNKATPRGGILIFQAHLQAIKLI